MQADEVDAASGSAGAAQQSAAVQEEDVAQQDKSPAAFHRWLQSIRTRLESKKELGDEGATEHASLDLLDELASALEQKQETWLLTGQEAMVRNVLSLHILIQRRDSPDAPLTDIRGLEHAVDVHHQHTLNAAASAQCMPAFYAYASLLALLHYKYNETSPADNELTLFETTSGQQESAVFRNWTGNDASIGMLSDGQYQDLGTLNLPTRSQAQAAGVADQWDALLCEDAIRQRLRDAFIRASGHASKSQQVFAIYQQFALTYFAANSSNTQRNEIDFMYQSRLRNPHTQIDATAQSYSTFVSRYHAQNEYEQIMTEVYTHISAAKQVLAAYEQFEVAIASTSSSSAPMPSSQWPLWKPYTSRSADAYLDRTRKRGGDLPPVDLEGVCAIFERAIEKCGMPPSCKAEMDAFGCPPFSESESVTQQRKESRQVRAERDKRDEQTLRAEIDAASDVWTRYVAFLLTARASPTLVFEICERAVRAVPWSGSLRGHVLRTLSRLRRPAKDTDQAFSDALAFEGLAGHIDSLVELLLARIDVERESAASTILLNGQASNIHEAHELVVKTSDSFMSVFGIISFALDILDGRGFRDETLRLESLLGDWCMLGPDGTHGLAESRWDTVLQQQGDNYLAWLRAAKHSTALGHFKKARNLYKGALSRRSIPSGQRIEVAQELLRLEHVAGSVADVEWTRAKLASEQERQWSEFYAAYATQPQGAQEVQSVQMADVEMTDKAESSGKRKASISNASDTGSAAGLHRITSPGDKRGRRGDNLLVRDRENSSVMVDNLKAEATEEDILALFKDCGDIREITGPKVIEHPAKNTQIVSAALVEFTSRDAVSAARSRNEKFVDGLQMQVQPGWQCTLYVTNFPVSHDSDASMRALFGKFGRIFDIRWPSKKFASNRRFCYVVFCNAREAQAALQLHDTRLDAASHDGKDNLQVLKSDPNRRKTRSDAFNDDRELFASGIPRGVSEGDVRTLLEPGVSDVRFLRYPDGRPRGLAYIDMETALDAQRVVGQAAEHDGGGYRLKGKLIAIVMVDKRKGQSGNANTEHSTQAEDDRRNRSVQLQGLADDAQEAIIQQAMEKHCGTGSVKRVLWTPGPSSRGTAIVEFHDATIAGQLALEGQVEYDGQHILQVRPVDARSTRGTAGSPASTSDQPATFAPRQAMGAGRRARGGLGFSRARSNPQQREMDVESDHSGVNGTNVAPKSQDTFRAMLNGK